MKDWISKLFSEKVVARCVHYHVIDGPETEKPHDMIVYVYNNSYSCMKSKRTGFLKESYVKALLEDPLL